MHPTSCSSRTSTFFPPPDWPSITYLGHGSMSGSDLRPLMLPEFNTASTSALPTCLRENKPPHMTVHTAAAGI